MRKPPFEPRNPEARQACAKAELPLLSVRPTEGVVWSIAGFDPSSGAGITADLMTFAAHGLFGCSAITALTVQNTVGVFGWEPVAVELLRETLERLWDDLPPLGIKIGMLGTPAIAELIAQFLQTKRAQARPVVVWDPVLRSSSGRLLYPDTAVAGLHEHLLPQVFWVMPNWTELALLTGIVVRNIAEAEQASRRLAERHPGLHVVATGGEEEQPTELLLLPDGTSHAFAGEHIATRATHGTGCAFSSALLANLVQGAEPVQAVRKAKGFVEGALRHAPGVGQGRGPMGLLWPLRRRDGSAAVASLEE